MSLRKWLYANIFVKLLDLITTFYLVHTYGVTVESQPFTADMITAYGLTLGLAINGSVHLMLIGVLYKFKRRGLLKVAAMLTALFPLTNFITIIIKTIGGT